MSEELLQITPQRIGKYSYYKLGNTTLNQLRANGIISKKNYGVISRKKPDGLIVYHKTVKAVIEYKTPEKLQSDSDLKKAIKQEIAVAKSLCKILIITDGSKTYWINALNGNPIENTNGKVLTEIFNPLLVKNINAVEYFIEEIDASISNSNSKIRSATLIDPSPLAARLWQTIWVATGKTPIKCLYNVVELFIFKFLSDLQILNEDIAFNRVYQKSLADPVDALKYYARNSRKKIYELFPKGKDETTLINGTIFVNETGEPNLSQAILFSRSLDHLQKYDQEFGSLTKIDKRFKTKLFESFLKQEVEALGQYLTPRCVIQSIIRLAGFDDPTFQYEKKRICDPFCGVGGFPLEILNMNENMMKCYRPDENCEIHLPFVIHGFDKGFEREDERTIILAKANMLIYLAELLFTNPKCTPEFSRIFNETFTLFRDNLGTFGHIIKDESDKYDLILSNPPYVTRGSGIIKEEIRKTPRTRNVYTIGSLGLEGLSVQWIIRSLNKNGKALIILPDGILSRVKGKKLRDHILRECYLEALISLPIRTFFSNFKHTYILAITKKNANTDIQTDPVFTYLVSNIGEKLTSVKREEIYDNDLPEMERLFSIFKGSRKLSKFILEKESLRCKIQDISKFDTETHWVINRWWTHEEKIKIGIEDKLDTADKQEFDDTIKVLNDAVHEYDEILNEQQVQLSKHDCIEVSLGNKKYFKTFLGKRKLKKDLEIVQGDVPVYSVNVITPMGFLPESNVTNFNHPSILWSLDGYFEFNLLPVGQKFATTDHCGTIQILDKSILPEYLLYALNMKKSEEDYDRSFRSSLFNIRRFAVTIPINKDGSFDLETQKKIASLYFKLNEKAEKLAQIKKKFDTVVTRYLTTSNL